MNAKRTRKPGKRRTNDGKKSAAKEIQLNESAAQDAADDEHWQINITIISDDRVQLVGILIRQPPPPPPFTPASIGDWLVNSINRQIGP